MIWELSILSAQFCCGPRTALRNKAYFKKKLRSCDYFGDGLLG